MTKSSLASGFEVTIYFTGVVARSSTSSARFLRNRHQTRATLIPPRTPRSMARSRLRLRTLKRSMQATHFRNKFWRGLRGSIGALLRGPLQKCHTACGCQEGLRLGEWLDCGELAPFVEMPLDHCLGNAERTNAGTSRRFASASSSTQVQHNVG